MNLSIVIPALEESRKIARDVEAAGGFLAANNLTGEIIVVDDGSRDATSEAAKAAVRYLPSKISLRVVRNEQHRGKGYAIRTGIKQTSGEFVMFADSGCCVPYRNVLDGLKMLQGGTCDIANGSRKLRESKIQKGQSWYRRICAVIFHWFVIYGMKIPAEFTDTQCGFKIYQGDVARQLYSQCITDGFMFDVEIVMRALKQSYRIKEFPIEWTCDRDSRLSPTRNLWHILRELITIKRTLSEE